MSSKTPAPTPLPDPGNHPDRGNNNAAGAPRNPVYKVIWYGAEGPCKAISDFLTEIYEPPVPAVSLMKLDPLQPESGAEGVPERLATRSPFGIPDTGDTPDIGAPPDISVPPDIGDVSDPGDTPDPEDMWQVEAYFTDQPEPAALNHILAAHGIKPLPTLSETLAPRDWVAHSLAGLGIVTCGRFILYGRHDADRLPEAPQTIPIRIEANQAFGTGHHPTTAGCLTLLDHYASLTPKSVLDLGTGSAVLAIAARKIWPARLSANPSPHRQPRVIASDIDPVSVAIARENAVLNAVEDIDFMCAAGFDEARIKAAAPFDFIFANILAGPLKALAPEMASCCMPGGHVMLAGMMRDQLEAVIAAYKAAGFRQKDQLDHTIWPVYLMQHMAAG